MISARVITSDGGGEREADDEGGHHLPAIFVHVAVKYRASDGVQNHSHHQHRELPARADESTEQHKVVRSPKYVAVNLV